MIAPRKIFYITTASFLSGCAGIGPGETGGTLLGAGGGAFLGSELGGTTGAIIGGAVGALGGNYLGREVDKNDKKDEK